MALNRDRNCAIPQCSQGSRRVEARWQVQLSEWVCGSPRFEFDKPERHSPAGWLSRREVHESMKKSSLLFVLLPVLAVAGFAQESRQDASVSATGFFPPFVSGNSVQQTSTYSFGGLASYRYMLTPRSAVEGNYQYTQYSNKYVLSFLPMSVFTPGCRKLLRRMFITSISALEPVPGGWCSWPLLFAFEGRKHELYLCDQEANRARRDLRRRHCV